MDVRRSIDVLVDILKRVVAFVVRRWVQREMRRFRFGRQAASFFDPFRRKTLERRIEDALFLIPRLEVNQHVP